MADVVSLGPRSALIIATQTFDDDRLRRLRSPAQDAEALATVLSDPAIGAFEASVAIDESEKLLRRRLAKFFDNRARQELLLVYYAGHGLIAPDRELFLAAKDTELDALEATALSAQFLSRLMDRTRARQVVLLLDACFAGAFARGVVAKAGGTAGITDELAGRGRVVITSSGELEYAFEGDDITGTGTTSVFTSILLKGLRTGEADLDGDGLIDVDELYEYVHGGVREVSSDQVPRYTRETVDRIIVARSVRGVLTDAGSAPPPPATATVAEPRVAAYEADPVITSDFWTVGDQLGYRSYAQAIGAFIQHRDTRPPLTIGIKAPWGAGKTSLMRMVQQVLDPPVSAPSAAGPEGRARIGLTPESRRRVGLPRTRDGLSTDDEPPEVTVSTVLKRLRRRDRVIEDREPLTAASPTEDDLRYLVNGEDWRPTVWFNPWMYQSGEQVWAGLAHQLTDQITSRMPRGDREHFWLSLNLARFDEDAVRRRIHRVLFERMLPMVLVVAAIAVLAVMAVAIDAIVGVPAWLKDGARALLAGGGGLALVVATSRAIAFGGEPAARSLDLLVREPEYAAQVARNVELRGTFGEIVREPGYDSRVGFLYLVQTDIERVLNLVATPERPLVVFVDDLDRCSPGTVCQVIEAINLFLAGQFRNCIFVIAMEPDVVAAHIEVAYEPLVKTLAAAGAWDGAGTMGWRFLDKIVQLPLSLPTLDPTRAGGFLGHSLATETNASPPTGGGGEAPARGAMPSRGEAHPAPETTASDRQERRRNLNRRLAHDSPEVRRLVDAAAGQLDRNPREIKRFVNVFRFYAFIRQEREQAAELSSDALVELAKLAVLSIRWPHLRGLLGRRLASGDERTVLVAMEATVRDGGVTGARDRLERDLELAGVPERTRGILVDCEDLIAFLAAGPPIGASATAFL